MDVFEILKKDHQRVRELFARMMQTARRDRTVRHSLFVQLKRELLAHERAEERALYPKLADEDKTRDLIEESRKEHHEVEQRLDRLEALSAESEEWLQAVRDLQKMVEYHAHEEEEQVFPKAQSILPRDQFDPLGRQVRWAEKKEKKRTAG